MTPARVNVLIAQFAYGGNGGISMMLPELAEWKTRTVIKMKADPRIDKIGHEVFADTPITMTRNRAVRMARENGFDMILMLDSDNEPDGYLEYDKDAKPFWETAFDFTYERYVRGVPTAIAAPYCGIPPHPVTGGEETPFLFEWRDNESDVAKPHRSLELLNRSQAAMLRGIYPVAALPTGVYLSTVSCYEPLKPPYFFYEFNEDHSEKRSTEDVVATRNISLHWKMTKGWDVVFAACDSWALHHKPKRVGRPRITPVETIAKDFRDTINSGFSRHDQLRHVDYSADLNLTPSPMIEEMVPVAAAVEAAIDSDYARPEKSNGSRTDYRMIGNRKVAAIGTTVTDQSIEHIQNLTSWLVEKRDGSPVEVAVIHAGSGQSAAAILSEIPDGSHLYALDSILTYQFSAEPADNFSKSFAPELESGRVMADITGRKFPYPEDQQHLDMAFIERSLTNEKLERWAEHVSAGGVIAGLGYEDAGTRKMVDRFVEANGYKIKAAGDVWAIPK